MLKNLLFLAISYGGTKVFKRLEISWNRNIKVSYKRGTVWKNAVIVNFIIRRDTFKTEKYENYVIFLD